MSAVGKAVVVTSCDSKLGCQLAKQLDDLVRFFVVVDVFYSISAGPLRLGTITSSDT